MFRTTIQQIFSEGKYGWQSNTITKEFSLMNMVGLFLLMARTGTGKSNAIYNGLISDKKKTLKGSILYCSKELIEQHFDGIQKFLVKNPDNGLGDYNVTKGENKITLHFETFKIIIKTFVPKTQKLKPEFNKYDGFGIHIDEFDYYQTQFGLNHLGSRYNYNKTSIKNHFSIYQKTKYDLLISLCRKRQIYGYSATLDETINSDLVPYEDKININVLVVHHKKETLDYTSIIHKNENEMIELLLNTQNKSIVYTSRIEDSDEICEQLDYYDIKYYRWDSQNGGKKIDMVKHNSSLISLFVNGGARGINNSEVKDVYIFRPLSASTRENREMISSLCNQMAGRIRNGGIVYWSREQDDDDYYSLIEKLYKSFDDVKLKYRRELFKMLNTKTFNISYIDNGVRLFIYNFIADNKEPFSKSGPILTNFNKFWNTPSFNKVTRSISNNNLSNEFIDDFIVIEQILVEEFIKTFKTMLEEDMHNILKKKTLKLKDSNSTGGSSAKTNISDHEREKGQLLAEKAINLSKLDGKSIYFEKDDDETYSDQYMHAYWKKDLDTIERTKSRYAIPMIKNPLEIGLNAIEDTCKRILEWDDISGITINYQNLLEVLSRRNQTFLRSEKDISTILKNYNKLQGNC